MAKAVVNLEAHSRLAHVLANDFGSVAGKVRRQAQDFGRAYSARRWTQPNDAARDDSG